MIDAWITSAWSRVVEAWAWLLGQSIRYLEILDQWRLLTPLQAKIVIFAVAAGLLVPVVHLWVKHHGVSHFKVITASLGAPLTLLALLQVPHGFAGTPDDNCAKYDNGHLVFTLLKQLEIPAETSDVYGSMIVVLLVRAPPRWGNEPHQCRLSFDDGKTKQVLDLIQNSRLASGRFSRGAVTFSFGGREETPNVKIDAVTPPQKTDPPEVPESKKPQI